MSWIADKSNSEMTQDGFVRATRVQPELPQACCPLLYGVKLRFLRGPHGMHCVGSTLKRQDLATTPSGTQSIAGIVRETGERKNLQPRLPPASEVGANRRNNAGSISALSGRLKPRAANASPSWRR